MIDGEIKISNKARSGRIEPVAGIAKAFHEIAYCSKCSREPIFFYFNNQRWAQTGQRVQSSPKHSCFVSLNVNLEHGNLLQFKRVKSAEINLDLSVIKC